MYDLQHPESGMYGSMAIGLPAVAVITGERDIGEDREQESGSAEAGNQDRAVIIGDAVIGDKL